jgi:vacuolar-type H+-ATPase subunit E/Vma4
MTIQALLTAIEAAGAARLAELEAAASAEAEAILAQAQAEADIRQQAAYAAALQPVAASRARQLHAARLAALRLNQAAQAERQTRLLEAVRAGLETARDRPDYRTALKNLIAEALKLLGTPAGASQPPEQRPFLAIDPRDEMLVAAILADTTLPVTVVTTLNCQGGVVARSADGRIMVDNTLAARLARLEPYLTALLPEPAADDRL